MKSCRYLLFVVSVIAFCSGGHAEEPASKKETLRVLFIGNSYTARHELASVVKRLAEAADPQLDFQTTQVIYGGRTLSDHWRFGTQHIVNRHAVTAADIEGTLHELAVASAKDPDDRYAPRSVKQMQMLLQELKEGNFDRRPWDWVVLQSYRDDLAGADSLYMKYVPKYVELAKAQGARVLLYETTPTTQNQSRIDEPVDEEPVLKKARHIAQLAETAGVKVAPMSFVALRCQQGNPELTLRFENDAHLNQTMAYLTACTLYAAMFDRSPEGLPVGSVTDIRFWQDNRTTQKDRDGKPITTVFSTEEQAFLQATAWRALQDFDQRF